MKSCGSGSGPDMPQFDLATVDLVVIAAYVVMIVGVGF